MSLEFPSELSDLSPENLRRLNAVCERFEADWRAKHRPRIEDFRGEDHQGYYPNLVQELILLEVEYRLRDGESPRQEEYVQRFPDLGNSWLERIWHMGADVPSVNKVTAPLVQQVPPGGEESFPIPSQFRYRVKSMIGKGGFGIVYLAYDEQLQRHVAVKVPHRKLVERPEDVDAYLAEARIVAGLDHPNIVPVYDIGSTKECPLFIVSMYVEGSTLARKIKCGQWSGMEPAGLVATLAETLHYAHRKGIVHRDIKPGNILLDTAGKPFIADFGLALKEENVGRGPRYVGTPAYMSPEQARGEGHRVDGRSDIFSLGVVFYELLTGRRPFLADTREELWEKITIMDARPPRQWLDTIPNELERICLKALIKRASDRYTTGKDMADDLRHFLDASKETGTLSNKAANLTPLAGGLPVPLNLAEGRTDKVVPKGLRSFDAHDADFFLNLLAGPRDRAGLPDNIRFWKSRIEEMDADNTFSVGLIYGPSGCGKSSLVKAGLLPRLAGNVVTIYFEAAVNDTETRLLHGLRKRCPELATSLGLPETLAALRNGQAIPDGKKVLIIVDQFEQWLHAQASRGRERPELDTTELVQALRQCDGGRVQCIVMVRDDFWLASTRFFAQLEVDLVQGKNIALADLFDLTHAKKVLAMFGRAFGKLPENLDEVNRESSEFLKQAIAGLAQDNKVICIRLALFAEMMKGRPWTPGTLKEMGGTEGVGYSFLEETFSSQMANPKHRLHQNAARTVLKALLPESGSDIKGHMRSHAELLAVCGYGNRPADFEDLIRILDSDIRLITPTDPEGKEVGQPVGVGPQSSVKRYYQLTHDYLVQALRAWLTRKQRETRRGRAKLLLTDQAGLWNGRPEKSQLPSPWQYLRIRSLTRKKSWTPPQRKMMRSAARYYSIRGVMAAILLGLIAWGCYEGHGALQAHVLKDRLLEANTQEVPTIVAEMASYRPWIDPLLQSAYQEAEINQDSRKQLHAALALLPVEAAQKVYLYQRLLDAAPQDILVLRDALAPHKDDLSDKLWAVVEKPEKGKEPQRLRAGFALATYEPDNPQWEKVKRTITNDLVSVPPFFLKTWSDGFRPVLSQLLEPLADIYRDANVERTTERNLATNILADYVADQPAILADLLKDADERQFAVLFPKFREHGDVGITLLEKELAKTPADLELLGESKEDAKEKLAKRQANAAVVLFEMNQAEKVWPLLKHSQDPRLRSYLIHRLGPMGADGRLIAKRLDEEPDVTIKRALILSLGEFGDNAMSVAERETLIEKLLSTYENDPDPGMRGAADWLLRQWGQGANLKALDDKLKINEAQLYAFLKAPRTEEQKRQVSIVTKELENIQNHLAEAEQTFAVRQAIWERKLLEQALAPLPAGLIAHYPLDEVKDNEIANLVAGQLPGTFQGSGKTHWVPGVMGQALKLDGNGTVVGGNPLDLEADQSFSCGCWFQYDANNNPTTPRMVLISTRDKNKGHRGIDLSLEYKHQLVMVIAGEDPNLPDAKRQVYSPFYFGIITNTNVDPKRIPGWHHVMATYDGSQRAKGLKIYVDGVPQQAAVYFDKFFGTIRSNVPLHLGSRHGADQFRGQLDDVRIYGHRLNDGEVKQLFESGIQALAHLAAEERTAEQKLLLANSYRPLDGPIQRLTTQRVAVTKSLRESDTEWVRRWYVNSQGQTMVLIAGPVEFMMGSPITEKDRANDEIFRKTRIDRTFVIGAKPVTISDYLLFDKTYSRRPRFSPDVDCPVISVDWYQAAKYCNWRSKLENIPEDQWCFETDGNGNVIRMKDNYINLTGYRLPTAVEREYACRAESVTARFYGETEELLGKYAWYLRNSEDRCWSVGSKMPNDFGLFDMHGNVHNWCLDTGGLFFNVGQKAFEELNNAFNVSAEMARQLRGGSHFNYAAQVRSATQNGNRPTTHDVHLGFRVARTISTEAKNLPFASAGTKSEFPLTESAKAQSAQSLTNLGTAYTNQRQFPKAIEAYTKAIDLDPKYLAAWINRGNSYKSLRQFDKAIEDYSRALELVPKDVVLWNNRAVTFGLMNQYDKSLADFSRAIELSPQNTISWYNRAVAYGKAQQYDKAIADYSKALDINPKYTPALNGRAITYKNLGQFDKVIADYTRLIELAPKGSGYMNSLAWLLSTLQDDSMRDPRRALELAKKAVELTPNSALFWNTLGVAHYRAGEWQAARVALEKSRDLHNGIVSSDLFFLAMTNWQLNQKEEARKVYDQSMSWMNANEPRVTEEIRRFQVEAAKLLGILPDH